MSKYFKNLIEKNLNEQKISFDRVSVLKKDNFYDVLISKKNCIGILTTENIIKKTSLKNQSDSIVDCFVKTNNLDIL